jgi:hypothetical protein
MGDRRVVWSLVGVLLAVLAVVMVVVGVAAFTRVPSAPQGETTDLALGLMSSLLALVCGVMSWACWATGARRRHDAGS